MMKVICAGLPKTGTKSMREALEILGYKNVADSTVQMFEQVEVLEKIEEGKLTDEVIRRNYDHMESFTDVPASAIADRMIKIYPRAKVLLILRDNQDEWMRSFRDMAQKNSSDFLFKLCQCPFLLLLFNKHFCPNANKLGFSMKVLESLFSDKPLVKCSDQELFEIYRNYDRKIRDVCEPERLLVYRVTEGWEPLCKFLGKEMPSCDFPWLNKDHEILKAIQETGTFGHDGGYPAKVQAEIKFMIIVCALILFVLFAVSLSYFY